MPQSHVLRLLPELHYGLRKGTCGKIGIIGGSKEYTGAPFFAAISAVKLGADLVHVFCPEEAAPVIKGYSPELMVHPGFSDVNGLIEKLERLDAIVLGPGLGRDPQQLSLVEKVLSFAQKSKIPTVIDADGLWFMCDLLDKFKGANSFFLTPNTIEFHRLAEKAVGQSDLERYNIDSDYVCIQGLKFVKETGLPIYIKGKDDLIFYPGWNNPVYGKIQGSPRRCGGQGDVTAGTLAVFYFWSKKEYKNNGECMKAAGLATHELVRTIAQKTYEKLDRSMTTSDMIEQICPFLMEVNSQMQKNAVNQ